MSNNIVHEFEGEGLATDVLAELQHRWEDKVIASRVAGFEPPVPAPNFLFPTAMQMMPQYPPVHNLYRSPPIHQHSQAGSISPFLGNMSGAMPDLAGVLPLAPLHLQGWPSIPQVDGTSEDSHHTESMAPGQGFWLPSLHRPQFSSPAVPPESETINSDLDDSDTDDEDPEDGAEGNSNTVFCNYDKVTRIKSKWKCVLNNGVIHANGKDYLFSKCTGEFEWA
ncbi:transcription factor IIA, alpha/beta subunit-domain-containing protein [Mycena leptocephala]|nr:transcription factor IIA, alpha/beta subunit-domain-containing protein [Mycena leptocephala]